MTVLSLPASPAIATIAWTLTQPTQANRSEFTGARRVTILPAAPRWSAKITFVTAIGEPAVKPLRGFLAALQGQVGQFRLPATEGKQRPSVVGAAVVDGTGQTGFSLATRGWFRNSGLRLGDFVTLNGQLLQLTADAVAGQDGKAVLTFAPYLRTSPADGDVLEVVRPYAVMSLADDTSGWSVAPGQIYDVSLSCEESF